MCTTSHIYAYTVTPERQVHQQGCRGRWTPQQQQQQVGKDAEIHNQRCKNTKVDYQHKQELFQPENRGRHSQNFLGKSYEDLLS